MEPKDRAVPGDVLRGCEKRGCRTARAPHALIVRIDAVEVAPLGGRHELPVNEMAVQEFLHLQMQDLPWNHRG